MRNKSILNVAYSIISQSDDPSDGSPVMNDGGINGYWPDIFCHLLRPMSLLKCSPLFPQANGKSARKRRSKLENRLLLNPTNNYIIIIIILRVVFNSVRSHRAGSLDGSWGCVRFE